MIHLKLIIILPQTGEVRVESIKKEFVISENNCLLNNARERMNRSQVKIFSNIFPFYGNLAAKTTTNALQWFKWYFTKPFENDFIVKKQQFCGGYQ